MTSSLTPIARDGVYYHYTSAAGLLGMLEGGKIWATDHRFLNDTQEFRYGLALLEEIFKAEYRERNYGDLTEAFRDAQQNLTDGFVCSFSKHGDSLGQWRSYCPLGQGYAVGVNLNVVVTQMEQPREEPSPFRVTVAECVYDERKQRSLVKGELIKWDGQMTAEALRTEEQRRTARRLVQATICPFLKNGKYSDEQEVRIVLSGQRQDFVKEGSPFQIGGRLDGATIKPFIELPLPRKAIEEIVVSPGPEYDQKLRGQALESLVAPGTKVSKSQLPFRGSW